MLNNIRVCKIKTSTEGNLFCSMSSYLLNIHCQNCMHFQIIRYIFIALSRQYQGYYLMQNCLITEGKNASSPEIRFPNNTLPKWSQLRRTSAETDWLFNMLPDEQILTSSKEIMPALRTLLEAVPNLPTCQHVFRLHSPVHLHWVWNIAVSLLSEERLALLN